MIFMQNNLFVEHQRLSPNEKIAIRDVPQYIFRYIEEPYLTELVTRGRLRIAPISYYRNEVTEGRLDRQEGWASQEFGMSNIIQWLATDAYSLCFSSVPLQTLKHRFNGSCLRISSPANFLLEIDKVIRGLLQEDKTPVLSSVANYVAYTDIPNFKFGNFGCAIHQAFIKPHIRFFDNHHYWIESEYRAVWELGTANHNLEPIFIEVPEVCKYVERVKDEDLLSDETIKSLRVRAYTEEDHKYWISTQKLK